ncbi:zinc knuckle-domain-containing protein [Sphaerosporella brunnea]|uniref:Zinc knuckle-domain-containing protein n=1 Tax=Sphaerosporella brunnea TaxID=1250544 RepID=A0A5J5EYC0_9PEZI|nr:zinc knuckle-domain-containing protein [Sphaerosporella brunnea]
MHRYRPYSSASRATPTTRCQKCLKLGHYSYECKATTQERPYISRPSRTQQLFNPKLQPKLTEAMPPADEARKGVADSILKAKEEDRSRKRRRDGSASPPHSRSSSVSSHSSYSSISSGRSRSPSPPPTTRSRTHGRGDKRRSDSYSRSPDHERSVRRKFKDSPSPGTRGRRLSPTDNSRRTRSVSPPRRIRSPKRRRPSPSPRMDEGGRGAYGSRREQSPPPPPPRERSPSPFTRRRLMTEAMQRGAR